MALENVTVVMGTRTFSNVHVERKQVQKIIIHKDYKATDLDSDLAWLLLGAPVQLTNFKMPVCLRKKEGIWHQCWMTEYDEYGRGLSFRIHRKPTFGFSWAGQPDALEDLA